MAVGDVYRKLGADAAITISPEGVATSSTLLAGVESDAITPADPVLDELVEGIWTAGTSPTGGQVDICVWGSFQATPVPPAPLDGTASAETFDSENTKQAAVVVAKSIMLDTTSNRAYPVHPFSIAALFGGNLPKQYGLFITQNSGVNAHATAGNHVWRRTPVYGFVAPS
jgi:hypothetical protein